MGWTNHLTTAASALCCGNRPGPRSSPQPLPLAFGGLRLPRARHELEHAGARAPPHAGAIPLISSPPSCARVDSNLARGGVASGIGAPASSVSSRAFRSPRFRCGVQRNFSREREPCGDCIPAEFHLDTVADRLLGPEPPRSRLVSASTPTTVVRRELARAVPRVPSRLSVWTLSRLSS